MNLDELRSVRRTERQKDSLQHLRDSFYEDVADYIAERKAERTRAAEAAEDPFSDPEVGQLTDEIETAEDVVEAIYERRVGKVVKLASFAAADMSADTNGLTAEERALFDDMVRRIKENRRTVLEVLGGKRTVEPHETTEPMPTHDQTSESDGASVVRDAAPAPESDELTDGASGDADEPSAEGSSPDDVLAEAMGGDAPSADSVESDPDSPTPAAETPDRPAADEAAAVTDDSDGRTGEAGAAAAGDADAEPATGGDSAEPAAPAPTDGTDRVTLRITSDVGQIFGVDEREYDLESEDVVTLPTTNAEPLVERGAAERLD
ncbi:DNA replication complex subunit Gins51 [Halopelagius longus]|uniref:DNA replication factor GINS n=1 Tax=Halopelagius longus TaxID=1236180 RepID=A0A1H0YZX1_9EURY|nr:hypothetical protein [Halopelagius longus]RDI72756.1 hypothetical protein DWB78_14055 [Halopelagius longus]SDQ20650.1 DNA replication factor GINS [Halopelagius longus]